MQLKERKGEIAFVTLTSCFPGIQDKLSHAKNSGTRHIQEERSSSWYIALIIIIILFMKRLSALLCSQTRAWYSQLRGCTEVYLTCLGLLTFISHTYKIVNYNYLTKHQIQVFSLFFYRIISFISSITAALCYSSFYITKCF